MSKRILSASSSRVASQWVFKKRTAEFSFMNIVKELPGYQFFHELFSTTEDLDREKYANEIALINDFFEKVEDFRKLPQVQELIESVNVTEDTGVPFKKAGDLAKSLAKMVEALGNKYQSKFRPEILEEVKRGPRMYEFRPTQIQEYMDHVNDSAVKVSQGRMGIPLFLNYFGVPNMAYQRRASLTEEQVQVLAKRIAKKISLRA